jgi:hypothetical protein
MVLTKLLWPLVRAMPNILVPEQDTVGAVAAHSVGAVAGLGHAHQVGDVPFALRPQQVALLVEDLVGLHGDRGPALLHLLKLYQLPHPRHHLIGNDALIGEAVHFWLVVYDLAKSHDLAVLVRAARK